MFVLLSWIALSALVGWMAHERGRDPYLWSLVSFFVSPLAGSLGLLLVDKLTK